MRSALERRLRDRLTEDGYLFPDYDRYCFANVPDTVRSVLGFEGSRSLPADVLEGIGDEYDRVLVLLVDGFGLDAWKRSAEHPFLERLDAAGTVSPLTTVYPSETAAAITTFHTGRLPAEHGVIGWDVYEPALDSAFQAFDLRRKGGAEPEGLEPADVFDGEPVYPDMKSAGLDPRHVVPFEATYEGATAHTYDHVDVADVRRAIGEAFDAAADPAYLFAYLPHVDRAAHKRGTRSTAYRESVKSVLDVLEQTVLELGAEDDGDTLVILAADHGHVDTDPELNVDLESIDAVMENLRRHADGEPVRFAGSPRNVHLHLRDGSVEAVRERLLEELDARVFRREEVLERGLFGDRGPSETFRRRLGDLVVTHRNLGVWYGEEEEIGMHGGLNPNEMLVPFAAAELDALRG